MSTSKTPARVSPTGRNNASGGILLEEGTRDFEVRECIVRRVRGNAIWTHSNYFSPRNDGGVIAGNAIEDVARDAIQVGHATNMRVETIAAAGSVIRWSWWIWRAMPCP